MQTIVIAGNRRTADSVLKFHALREQDPYKPASSDSYEAVAAFAARRSILGTAPDRIIIASDYLKWHFVEPGELTALWRMIKVLQARGTRVVWS